MDYNQADYLIHYGVLGMKWGRRKTRRNLSNQIDDRSTIKTEKENRNEKYKKIAKKVAIGAAFIGASIAVGYTASKIIKYQAAKPELQKIKSAGEKFYKDNYIDPKTVRSKDNDPIITESLRKSAEERNRRNRDYVKKKYDNKKRFYNSLKTRQAVSILVDRKRSKD